MPKVTFKKNFLLREDTSVEAEPGVSILELAEEKHLPVGSNCGGVCACSTCHVYVIEGFDDLDEMDDKEADRLDMAFDVRLNSRLGCQTEIGEDNLIIDISEESLKAYLDEHPKVRKHFEATGEFVPE